MEKVDVIIIGSGQGGVPLATELAEDGRKVIIFERTDWGGSCINYGCTPSKAFLASAHAAHTARRAAKLGIETQVFVDFPKMIGRVRELTASWSQGTLQRLENAGVQTVAAEASFTRQRTVIGGGQEFQAPLVVVNTGKSPFVPDISGLENSPYLTFKNFWDLDELPQKILILGGGFVSMELGQALARLGSEVHIIERNDRLIHREEADVSETLKTALGNDGVGFHLDTHVRRVAYTEGKFHLYTEENGFLNGNALLIATGRKANTGALNTSASGIELDEVGNVKVDKHFRTTCEGVYAIGDVTGQPGFTHVSWEDHRRLQTIIKNKNKARTQQDRVLAYAIFTDPQVGRAGLTLEQAEAQGHDAEAATLPLEQVARASEVGKTRGFYRMVVDRGNDRILGATLVGPQAAELVHTFVAHMQAGSTWHTLEQSVHIHPTFAEGLPTLARKFKGEDS